MIPVEAFSYETRAIRVVLRPGAAGQVRDELSRIGVRRPFLITTPGRADVARGIAATLDDLVGLFDRSRIHVPVSVVDDAAASANAAGTDSLVAIGGGSAIGVAKAVAVRTGFPIIALPTTYSGSEMTSIWGMTDRNGKRTGRDERVAPRVVVYDPLLTLELDARTSAASGMNAIAHCVETLFAPDPSPLASLLAVEAIRVMARSLPMIVRDGRDVEARISALYAAHLAGRALDMTVMGLHHRLCHVLGGTFGLPHALTHAIVLPHVVAWNAPAAPRAMAAVTAALAAAGSTGEPDGIAEADAALALHRLNLDLGITETLEDLGLRAADTDRAADLVVQASFPNPRPVTRDGVTDIIHGALQKSAPAASSWSR